MNRILCSTGTSIGRPNGRNFRLLSECARRLECDGFEFMMYSTWYDQLPELEAFMKDFPAPIPVVHVEKGVGERISRNEPGDTEEAVRLFAVNCELACKLGAETLVLHLWNGVHSDKEIGHNISLYPALNEIAERNGLLLTIENVVCNQEDPMTHLKRLANLYPEIAFTFDTKMAQFHDQLPLLYEKENEEILRRVRHMHINDYSGGYKDWTRLKTLHIGDGQVDFERLFAFLGEINYRGDFTVEATSLGSDGVIDFDALNRDFARIREWQKRWRPE